MKPQLETPNLTKPTALTKEQAAKLREWITPHVEAIAAMHKRIVEMCPDGYDEVRFHLGWARHYLIELQYVAGKAAGLPVSPPWMDDKKN